MKKILTLLSSCVILTSCYDPAIQEAKTASSSKSKTDTSTSKTTILVAGSTTMQPIMQSVSNYFLSKNDHFAISIKGSGSNEGLKAMWHDSADIAMSSHELTDSVVNMFRKKKMEYAEFLLAGDALVFVVNINNPVKKLTDEQLKSIYAGEITNWKQLGGIESPIKIYSRDQSSGTFNFFKEIILKGKSLPLSAVLLKNNVEILKHVGKEKGAIGYASFADLDYSVDPLDISFDGGKTYIGPRIETVNNLKYKYFRGLFLYYKPEVYAKIKPFLDTVKTDSVQKILRTGGYIPLSHRLIANQ